MVTRAPSSSLILIASLSLAACAPGTEVPVSEQTPASSAIPDSPITEAEQAAGAAAHETGQDYFPPTADTDGDLGRLAQPLSELPVMDHGATSTIVDADTACTPAQGYVAGSPRSVCVVAIDGKLVEYRTAEAYVRMRSAAASAGVHLTVVSGFRTMEKQRELYNLYLSGRGNLAARPGYSNHQSGLALDLNTSASGVLNWLNRHGSEYGFRRTVPSEIWHWERPAGSQGTATTSGGTTVADGTCFSSTLNRSMPTGACVQSSSDRAWYHCTRGTWYAGQTGCTSSNPLGTPATVNTARTTCYSSTVGRELPAASCVQSRVDRLWYQCASNGWVQSNAITSSHSGPVGACSGTFGL